MKGIEGLTYDHIPGNGTRACVLCTRPACRCEARHTPKPRQRYRPGIALCGGCWEDGLLSAIYGALADLEWEQAQPRRKRAVVAATMLLALALAVPAHAWPHSSGSHGWKPRSASVHAPRPHAPRPPRPHMPRPRR